MEHQKSTLIPRDLYIDQIRPFMDQPVVKVLSGIRRGGKSSMLELMRDNCLDNGVASDHTIYLDFETLGFGPLAQASALLDDIVKRASGDGTYYLFIDEIQEVEGWERVIAAVMKQCDVDVMITGSNSRLLSSELATYIAGRYVSFEVWPLSFAEHQVFMGTRHPERTVTTRDDFADYLRRGGFPITHVGGFEADQVDRLVADIYTSVLLRDTVSRRAIRNPEMLERVVRFVFDNVGSPFSANSIAAYFKSQQRRIDPETVYSYLNALEEAFLVAKVPRFDIRGKEWLKTQEKYYVADHSLVWAMCGYSPTRLPGALENIVWSEARRRGYRIGVGKLDDSEIDFVIERRDERVYIQVAYILADQATVEREIAPLRRLRDQYHAYVVSLDPVAGGMIDGIQHVSIPDFLLQPQW